MAIADRITSIEEHIKESYQELEGIGIDITGVDKNLENIPKLIDEYWETLPKVTGEGTSITLDNTKEGKMKIVLKGNTYQEETPTPDSPVPIQVVSGDNTIEICGRNLGNPNTLFDEMYNSGYANPPTRTIVDNRNVISFSTYYSHNKPLYVTKYKENTQYTFRVVAKAAESALRYLYIIIDYTDGTKSSASIPNQGTSWDELRIVSTENKTIKDFYFSYSNAGYWYIDEDSFNIIEGDTTNYETYQGTNYNVNLPIENLFTSSIYNDIDVTGNAQLQSNGYYEVKFPSNKTIMEGEFEENTQYTISCMAYGSASGNSGVLGFNYTDNTNEVKGINQTTPYLYTITSSAGKTVKNIKITYGSQNTTYIKDLQLEYGNKKNSFTPYGTTPIELCKIGTYQDRFIRNSGKNLLEPSSFAQKVIDTPYSSANVSTYDSETGELSIKMGNSSVVFDNFKENTQYTIILKYNIATNGSNLQIAYTDNTTQNITPTAGSGIFRLITTEGKSVASIKHSAYDSTTPRILYLKESGIFEGVIETTDFEPYGSGKWYLNKQIGKIVLDGSESWANYTNLGNNSRCYYIKPNAFSLNSQLFSNYFIKSNLYETDETGIIINPYGTSLISIKIPNSDLETQDLAGYKTWLSTHNTIVYYVLATPTYTLIEDTTLINQLETIKKSYEGQTNITQENNDLASLLNATALEEMS